MEFVDENYRGWTLMSNEHAGTGILWIGVVELKISKNWYQVLCTVTRCSDVTLKNCIKLYTMN